MTKRFGAPEGALLALAAAAGVWFSAHVLQMLANGDFLDFAVLFEGGRNVRDGLSPYRPGQAWSAPLGAVYNKLPIVAILLSPFCRFPFAQVARSWVVVNVVLYAATLAVLTRSLAIQFRSPDFYLTTVLFLVFQPTLDTLYGGQLEILLLFLLALAHWALSRPGVDQTLAGVSVGLAILLKVYPLLFLLCFFLGPRRYWRAFGASMATLLALTLLSVLWVGWHVHVVYWVKVLPYLSRGTPWVENQSFFGFFARLFADGTSITTTNQPEAAQLAAARVLSYVAMLAAGALSLRAISRAARADYALVVLIGLVLLVSPNAWIHYETILLIPLGVLLVEYREHPFFWLAVGLVALGNESILLPASPRLLQSYKFYGVLLTWLGTVFLPSGRTSRLEASSGR